MTEYGIYGDIAMRTQGDIYIGVVGPVRTGKSTFIKRFMDMLVIPNIENEHIRERTRDELPQSAAGKTVMTTEPKFIPNEAVRIKLDDNASFNVRMIDCVGYVVNGAEGSLEDDNPRMVSTPWFEEDIPFESAARIGTQKVIREHSTIGLVVTTDGTICDIARSDYAKAEEEVISELKEINKPFIILLNSANPSGEAAKKLRAQMEEKYAVPVFLLSCAELNTEQIREIIKNVLFEFPIKEIGVNLPSWVDALKAEHYLKQSIYGTLRAAANGIKKISDAKRTAAALEENEYVKSACIDTISLGTGEVTVCTQMCDNLFYKILSEETNLSIENDGELIHILTTLSVAKAEYDRVAQAIKQVRQTGYGIVSPSIEELTLKEPEIIRQGGRYGVRLRASAPSIHLIRADIETEHLIYKMKMGIKSEKKYQDFEIEYRIAV